MKAISLSKREKVLLYILACLLIFVVGWYLMIMPTLSNKKKLDEQYASLQTGYQRDKETAALYNTIDHSIKEGLEDIETYKAKFYPIKTTDEIDKLLTTLVQKHGFVPISLGLEEAKSEKLTGYLEEVEKNAQEDTTKQEETIVKVMHVSQVVHTSAYKSNVSDYIETLRTMPGVSLTNMTSIETPDGIQITFTYSFYMIEK